MTIMDGFKLGVGLYFGYNLSKSIDSSLGRVLAESSFYRNYMMPHTGKVKRQPVKHEAKPKNPVGFGHTYD